MTDSRKLVALFGTCRVSSFANSMQLVKATKSRLTGGGGGLASIYSYNNVVYECHPFNYTTKLYDCIDALKYLQGSLYDGNVSANSDYNFFRLYCRGYHDDCFYRGELAEPGSIKSYDCMVFEICSLRQIVIKSRKFGPTFFGGYLPWNISIEQCHQKFDPQPDDFMIVDPSLDEIERHFELLLALAKCPVFIIGPYMLPYAPTGRALHGENDLIPIDKINSSRYNIASVLRDLCQKYEVRYFDMTNSLRANPSLLRNQYHFSLEGESLFCESIKCHVDELLGASAHT